MFKKPPQPKGSANIKSSERRHLLTEICKEYGINKDNLSKDDELALVPSPIKQASYQSIQGHKGTIYFDSNERPVWFKPRDHAAYPTLFTLWKAAYLLPIVLTNSHVIDRLSNHANLMLPGCIPPFDPRMTRGKLVGVASYQKPTVIMAIGHCSLNLTQFTDVVGRQGTAVTMIHSFDDELFKLYDGEFEIPEEVNAQQPTAAESDETQKTEQTEELEETEKSSSVPNAKEDYHLTEEAQEPTNLLSDDLAETVSELSVEDTDNLFIRSFIQTVKNSKLELPMTASKFMEYILKNFPRTEPKFCNIKKTSWKKSAKFLKSLEKLKYLTLKGKGDDVNVVAINISPEIVASFVPHKTMEDGKGSGSTPSKKELDHKMNVVSLYKPTNKARMVFNKLDKNYNALYTKAELKDILNEYIKVQQLVDKSNPKNIALDVTLLSITGGNNDSVPRDKLLTAFVGNFSPNFAVLKPKEELSSSVTVHRGDPPKIKILTQTVLGRKKTTSVLNFEKFHLRPNSLAEDLKNLCSGSTSVSQSVHNPAITEVMVQGPHGPTIIDYLKKKGIPVAYIDFEDKSKGKRRK